MCLKLRPFWEPRYLPGLPLKDSVAQVYLVVGERHLLPHGDQGPGELREGKQPSPGEVKPRKCTKHFPLLKLLSL